MNPRNSAIGKKETWIAAGSPLMLANRLVFDEQGILLLATRLHMRTDIQKLEMSRKRTMTAKRLQQ